MIYHSLICMLQDASFSTNSKTLRVNMDPNIEKIREVYSYNLNALNNLIIYCKNNQILSLRVSSSLFPLLSHVKYEENCWAVLKDILPKFKFDDYINTIQLSSHPDQFILLSSANPGVNLASIKELETYAYITDYIPMKLINIHVGSAAGGIEKHGDIFLDNFSKLSPKLKSLLSLENDEKSYSFLDTLAIAQRANCMVVADFHHNRCYHRRKNEYASILTHNQMDAHIYDNIDNILKLYEGKLAYPTFHLSSPKGGWCSNFKEECAHSDYIDFNDYPQKLIDLSNMKNQIFILDIEAKAKEEALYQLRKEQANETGNSNIVEIIEVNKSRIIKPSDIKHLTVKDSLKKVKMKSSTKNSTISKAKTK